MRLFAVVSLALTIGLASAAAPWASAAPDGLEKVAADKGFADRGEGSRVQEDSPAPEYAVPGIEDPRLATGAAGFAGTLMVFALGYGGAALARRRRLPHGAL